MILESLSARILVPDDTAPLDAALARTTHLAIGAHQDDLEIFAYHGIETCHGSAEQWFGGITVTDGGGSARSGPFAHYSDEEMRAVRRREQDDAARLGAYAFQAQLGHPSAATRDPAASRNIVEELVCLLRATRPATVYLHNPADKHATHLAVLDCSWRALRQLAPEERPTRLYGCEVWRDLDWLDDETKVALPVGRDPELERALLAVFRSQVEGGKDYVSATLGRRRANATFHHSHAVDEARGCTFAIDLTALLADDAPTLPAFIDRHLAAFREAVGQQWRWLRPAGGESR